MRYNAVPIEVVKYLAVNPFITTNGVTERLNVAYTTAARVIAKLESLEILSKVNGKKRNRVYCAKKVLAILERPTKLSD